MLILVLSLVSRSARTQEQGHVPRHLTTDWSNRHMVFSGPSSMMQAWRLQAEPRYADQWVRRNVQHQDATQDSIGSNPLPQELDADDQKGRIDWEEGEGDPERDGGRHRHRPVIRGLHRDWGMSLLINATVGDEMFPAKFSFDVNATPDCTNDFVVFNTGATPVAKDAFATGTFNGMPTNGQTATITNGANSMTLTASGAPATGTATITTVPVAGDTITVGATTYTFDTSGTGTATITTVPVAGDTIKVGATTYTFDTSGTGTITIGTVPVAGDTVTVGATTYKFVAALANPNDVLIVAGSMNNNARNLEAAINANTNQCSGGPPCYGTGTTANASVTATRNNNVVTVTAITSGPGGNSIALATTSGGRITVSGATLTGGAGGTLSTANEVLAVTGDTANTANNLQAAINASMGQCGSGPPCFGTGTTANASVTASAAGNVVTVTAITSGAGGNSIVFTTASGGRITLSPNTGTLSGGAGGTLSTANEVLAVTGDTANTARNLRAAIDASTGQCGSGPPCWGTGTTANASVTASAAGSVVTVTAITYGTAGNSIVFTTASGGRITLSPNTGTLSGGITALNTGGNFALDGNTTDAATNLAAAIVRGNAAVGVTATSNGTVVTVTATTAGSAGNSITLTNGLANFTWSGGTLSGGNDGQPTIIAFNELYSTQGSVGGACNQNGPSVMWSYNADPSGDTTGTDPTSPILSIDGTKVAFVETRTNANGGAILHILKWKSGEGTLTAPVSPDQVVASWGSCTAGNSCIVNLTFHNAPPSGNSSPFYVYNSDILYVGDDNGALHKFSPVFSGTPAEVTTGGWPITVHSGNVLSSPVFDSGSSNILVGDSGGQISYVKETGSVTGSCSSGSAPCLGTPSIALTGSVVDGPLVDSSTQRAIWFDGQDTTNHGEVVQTDTALGNKTTLAGVGGSGGTPTSNMHVGAFDHTYITSPSNNIAGFLYFIGKNHGANRDHPCLWRVGFSTTGVMNTTPDGSATACLDLVGTSGEEASPVTELNNGATDRIFFSVGNNSSQCAGGPGGCIMSLTLGGSWPPGAVTNAVPTPVGPNIAVTGGNVSQAGTSGIVVDNVSASAQASSIYFSYTGNSATGAQCNGVNGVGCAIKLTQSGLN
jgi:hypothetical protein